MHRLRAVRRRVPGEVHLRARRRQPTRRARVTGRALRLRLRDQLPPVHPLRPVRRGVPDRGHHRDEAVRVLVHQPRRTRSTRSASSLVDDNGRARRQPWELWLGGEDDDTSAWMRATAPSGQAAFEGKVAWSGELGFGVRDPELGQSATPALTAAPDRCRGAGRSGDRPRVTVFLFFLFGGLTLAGALGVVLSRNPVHSRALPRADAPERRGPLPAPGRAARRGRAGDRLRRCHRGALPLRDHAPGRRPARGAHRGVAVPAADRRSRSARSSWPSCSFLGGTRVGDRSHDGQRRTRERRRRTSATTSSASPGCCSPTSSGRSSSPQSCW